VYKNRGPRRIFGNTELILVKGAFGATLNMLLMLGVIHLTVEQLAAINACAIAYLAAFGASATDTHPQKRTRPRVHRVPPKSQT